MIRVFLADDHAIVRDGLRRLLAEAPGLELAGETGSGRDVLARAGKEPWDVLVLDLSLDDLGGLEVLWQLRRQVPKLPVVVCRCTPRSNMPCASSRWARRLISRKGVRRRSCARRFGSARRAAVT